MTARWSETQHLVAGWLRDNGWPYAEPVGSGRSGVDVTGCPGLAVEVKSAKLFDLPGWLRQAALQGRAGLPVVVYRPQGFGRSSLGDWPAVLRLSDLTKLLREAGYVPDGHKSH